MNYLQLIHLFWPSLLIGSAVAIAGGVLGVFVLLRRDALVALTMPHAVAVGAAVGLRLGWPTLPLAAGAVVIAIGLLAWSRRRDTAYAFLPAVYIAALCGSFLIIAGSGEHLTELQQLFTGIDVAVGESAALYQSPVLLIAAAVCAVLWRRWLLLAQAPATAEVAGLHPARWETAYLALLAVVFVIGTSNAGVVMVLAMLFLPAATVLPWAKSIPQALAASAGTGLAYLAIGFVLSIECDWPFSQSAGLAGFVGLLLSSLVAQVRRIK